MFKIDNQIQVIVKKDLKEQLHDRANLFGFFFFLFLFPLFCRLLSVLLLSKQIKTLFTGSTRLSK